MTERLPHVTITKNITVSTLSYLHAPRVGEKGSDLYRWIVKLDAAENLTTESKSEDLTQYIKSVEFVLHQTFTQPRRLVEQPPYEITEIGWGEFEINVRINFQDTQERPVELRHQLRLRPDPEHDFELYENVQKFFKGEVSVHPQAETPVVRHTCDQLVFSAPHEWFYEKLKVDHTEGACADDAALAKAITQEEREFEQLVRLQNVLRRELALGVEELMAVDWEIRREKEKDNQASR